MNGNTAMVIAKSFTKDTADEFGAVKGANCQISRISFDTDENTVIDFLWVNTAGKTISDTAIIKKGNKGDKGNGIKELKFNADGKLVAVLDDGTETTPVLMPSTKVDISKETGNVIEEKTDGLYVGATGVEISKDTDNAIETKSDGLYVKKTNSAEISKKADNIIKQETDGLYVPKADAQVQADFNQTDVTKADFIKNKPTVDQTYSATSENAQSGKSVASAIATEIGKLTYLSKEIATKTEIDSYVADPTKAKFNTIYLLKDASAKGSDKYFEYQRIGDATTSTFEQTGDTSTDLTDYAKSEDVVAIQQKTEDAGKALVIGADGKVTLDTVATNDIGSVELNMLGWNVPKECEIQNAVSGNQFTQNVGRVDLGTLDFAYDTTNSWFYVKDLSLNAKSFPNADVFNGYCANYENKSRNTLVTEEGIGINITSTIIVKDSNYSDADTFKNAVKGLYLYFELATPIEKVIEENEIIPKLKGATGVEVVDIKKADYDKLTDDEVKGKFFNTTDEEDIDLSAYAKKENVVLKEQGTENKGKVLGVGTDGDLSLIDNLANYVKLTNDAPKIPDGTDLNDVWKPGVYICMSGVNAQTLVNCPYTLGNFRLEVVNNTGTASASGDWWGWQILTANNQDGRYYIRHHNKQTWLDWEMFGPNLSKLTLSQTRIDSGDLNTYLTEGEYRCLDATTAAKITNNPCTSSGFKLTVLQRYTSGSYQQVIEGISGLRWERNYTISSKTWSAWSAWRPVVDTYSSTSSSAMSGKAIAGALGTQCTFSLSGTTLTITPKS